MFGDVPAPRRDAAAAVAVVAGPSSAAAAASAAAATCAALFVHGGCAADGEPLADVFRLDISTLVGRCTFPVSKPDLKARLGSAFETKM